MNLLNILRAQYVVYESLHLQNDEFKDNFEYLYLILDSMVEIIKTKPVDVISLNKKLNELKTPSLEGYDLSQYFTPEIVMPFPSSRGCYWRKCSF